MFDLNQALERMSEDQREHLRIVITELIQCYVDQDLSGMVLIGKEPYTQYKVMMVNAGEMEAAKLLRSASTFVHDYVMEDAPPKEKFN
jgi:hypothetical protein